METIPTMAVTCTYIFFKLIGFLKKKSLHTCLRNKYNKFAILCSPILFKFTLIQAVRQYVSLQWTVHAKLQSIQVLWKVSFTRVWMKDAISNFVLCLVWRTVSSSCGTHNCKQVGYELYIEFKERGIYFVKLGTFILISVAWREILHVGVLRTSQCLANQRVHQ